MQCFQNSFHYRPLFIIQFFNRFLLSDFFPNDCVRLLVILYHSSSSIFLASPLGTFIKNSFFVLTIFIASLILIVKLFSFLSLVGFFFYLFLKLLKQCCTINRDYFSCVLFRFAFFYFHKNATTSYREKNIFKSFTFVILS